MFAFDRYSISFSDGLRFSGPRYRRLGEMLVLKERSSLIFNSPVLYADGCWRLYYLEEILTGENKGRITPCYAESMDGLQWQPMKELSFKGISDEAYIGHYSILPPIAKDSSWRLFGWIFDTSRKLIRFACFDGYDGIHWNCRNFSNPGLLHPSDGEARNSKYFANDVTAVYRLPGNGFELYGVWLAGNPKGGVRFAAADNHCGNFRIIQRRVSSDGINWSEPELLLTPNSDDPPQIQNYYLNITHLENFQVGMVGRYDTVRQVIEPELIISRDGIAWERPCPYSWLRLDDEGEDAGLIHTGQQMVDLGDRFRLYYSVSRFRHNNRQLGDQVPRHRGIYAVEVSKGRMLGLSGSGVITTRPFLFSEDIISINADIQGILHCELLDLNGNLFSEAMPVTGDSERHKPHWNKIPSDTETVSMRMKLEQGTFYRLNHKRK